jgi:cytidylate kinase
MPIITIRGKIGSGAPEIGKKVADKLNIDYIDSKIIAEVAARLNLEEHEVIAKEMPPCTLRERIEEALQRGYATGIGIQGAYLPITQIPLDDNRYLEALTHLLEELAEGHSAVIFGRGGQFILRKHPRTINVSIVAPFPVRLKRVMEEKNLKEEQARQDITHKDNAAREFIRRFFKAEMEDPVHYDLVINTEYINYDAAVSVILETLRLKQDESDGILKESGATA